MRLISFLFILSLANCASMGAVNDCQDKAGPKPYASADLLGIIGVIAANQSDDRQIWYKSVDDCMAKWRANNP